MRRVMLACLFALSAAFLAVLLAVTVEDQAAKETKTYLPIADGGKVAGAAEEAEPPDAPASPEPPPPFDGKDVVYDPTDPPLKKLLHCSTKHDTHRTSRFFTALKAVFRANNLPLTDREPGWNIDEGNAVPVSDGTANYMVWILRG